MESIEAEVSLRGAPFSYDFTLPEGWLGDHFTGGVYFVLRKRPATSATVSDADAVAVASTENERLTFDGAVGSIRIPATVTHTWPVAQLHWDIKGRIIEGNQIEPLGFGTVEIRADIGRELPEA